MEQITFYLAIQVLEENLMFLFSKYLKEMVNEIEKYIKIGNHKRYIVCEKLYSEDQLIK